MSVIKLTNFSFNGRAFGREDKVIFATPDQPLYALASINEPWGGEIQMLHGGTELAWELARLYGIEGWSATSSYGDKWTQVDPDDPTVPAEVWTKLAEYRLTRS